MLFLLYQHNTLNMAREDSIDIFRPAGSRKHVHGIFCTIGRREHINRK